MQQTGSLMGSIYYCLMYSRKKKFNELLFFLHQWYWSYEYSDMLTESGEAIEFDSYMIPESDLEIGQLRLLDVDQRLVVPVDTHVRYIVTGASSRPKYFEII